MRLFYFAKKYILEAHRLSEVNEYIRQVIAVNFEDSLWVIAEISQIKFSGKHVYLELIEKDERTDEVIAGVSAAIWYQSFQFIRNKLGDLAEQILTEGTQIQCKIRVDYHAKYGLKFIIQDIDASYTFGQLEIERQKTIERLQREGLIGKNREKALPLVIQRIAVISSKTAAGLQDFLEHLKSNPYGYAFQTVLFQSSVQGKNLEKEMIGALEQIASDRSRFDCVAILRGGGSKLDLSGFDQYDLARKVALFPLPVLTGIGHDIDTNVIEMVAHSPEKTPTAAANYIIDHNVRFESSIIEFEHKIGKKARDLLHIRSVLLDNLFANTKLSVFQVLSKNEHRLAQLFSHLLNQSNRLLTTKRNSLDALSQRIELSNPFEILKKGYVLSYQDGKLIREGKKIDLGKTLDIQYFDGKLEATAERFYEKKEK
jgi:exodeoxyribonuclease VII large subunit